MPSEPTIEELNRRLRECERTIELLREESRKLDAALNNMSQGLCLYDAQARLVLCNRRYLEILDLPTELAVPGRTLREMIERRQQLGVETGDPQRLCDEILGAISEGKTDLRVLE